MSRAIKDLITKLIPTTAKTKLNKMMSHQVREAEPNDGFKKAQTFDMEEKPILIGKKMTQQEKETIFEEEKYTPPTSAEAYELAKQEQFYRDNVVSRLKSKNDLETEPIPDYITLGGFNKERALNVVTSYYTQYKAREIFPDEDMIEALEKVHYGCMNDTPVKKETVLKVLPDFKMQLNTSFSKVSMGENAFQKLFDKAREDRINNKTKGS